MHNNSRHVSQTWPVSLINSWKGSAASVFFWRRRIFAAMTFIWNFEIHMNWFHPETQLPFLHVFSKQQKPPSEPFYMLLKTAVRWTSENISALLHLHLLLMLLYKHYVIKAFHFFMKQISFLTKTHTHKGSGDKDSSGRKQSRWSDPVDPKMLGFCCHHRTD